jgi:two-component system cell cycle sensor histidine kinase/response regulator CckA
MASFQLLTHTTIVGCVGKLNNEMSSNKGWSGLDEISTILEINQIKDEIKTKEQLIDELMELRQSVAELEKSEIQRKQAETALQQSEEKYRTLIDNIQDGIFIIQDAKVQFANEAFAKMVGYTVEEVLGKDFRELVAPEDLDIVEDRYNRRQAGEDVLHEYEFRALHRDGKTRIFVNTNIGLITYSGRVAIVGTVKDITEHKRAKDQIQEQAALIDYANDAITILDLGQRITYYNKSAKRLYGWIADEAIGKNADEFLYKDEKKSLLRIEAQKSVMEKGEWIGELHQITKDGKEIVVESRWSLIRNNEGKPRSILIINTDITEKKRLESQFLRAQRLEGLGTLAGGIAHDLNNVLTPVMLSVQILKEKFTDEQSQKLLDILERNTQRGADLIKQVLSFARGVNGDRKNIQVTHLIYEIKKVIQETFPKSIEVRIKVSNDFMAVSGDVTQLHQVLMNLCLNARDAMQDGGILGISAEQLFVDENYTRMNPEAKVGPYIVLTISDTGKGIPPEILDRIFEPFFTTKEQGKGTGLGLSTAFAIVKSHGGFIDVHSKVGKGTMFRVYLPAIKADRQKTDEQQLELYKGQGEVILVVDDESSIREITSSILEINGYRVITARDGMEAISLYTKNRKEIKVVLMDMMMPVMDGQASVRALRKIDPKVKIIAMSGLAEKEMFSKIADHVNVFLSKPYTTEKLLKTICKSLNAK